MGELPISDEAQEAAAVVIRENVARPSLGPNEMLLAAIRAAFIAEGLEVEKRSLGQGVGRNAPPDVNQRRLVSPWKPIPEQGTKPASTEGER